MARNDDEMAEVERLKAKMLKQTYYVMSRRIVDPAALKPRLLEHYRWIIGLEKAGLVLGSGPLFGRDGTQGVGMTIFRVPDEARADELAASDPFVLGGAAEYELQRWQVNEGRVTLSLDFSDQTFSFA